MAMNPIDQDLAGAYKRHGGAGKAWKHLATSRGKKLKEKGGEMVDYFKNKISGMKDTAAGTMKGAALGASAGASIGGALGKLRGKTESNPMKKFKNTMPMKKGLPSAKFKTSMPMKTIGGDSQKNLLKKMMQRKSK